MTDDRVDWRWVTNTPVQVVRRVIARLIGRPTRDDALPLLVPPMVEPYATADRSSDERPLELSLPSTRQWYLDFGEARRAFDGDWAGFAPRAHALAEAVIERHLGAQGAFVRDGAAGLTFAILDYGLSDRDVQLTAGRIIAEASDALVTAARERAPVDEAAPPAVPPIETIVSPGEPPAPNVIEPPPPVTPPTPATSPVRSSFLAFLGAAPEPTSPDTPPPPAPVIPPPPEAPIISPPPTVTRPPLFGPAGLALRAREESSAAAPARPKLSPVEAPPTSPPGSETAPGFAGRLLGCLDLRSEVISTYLAWPDQGWPEAAPGDPDRTDLDLTDWATAIAVEARAAGAPFMLTLPITTARLIDSATREAFAEQWLAQPEDLRKITRFCLRNPPAEFTPADFRDIAVRLREWGRAPALLAPPSMGVLRLLAGQGFYAVAIDHARWSARLGAKGLADRLPAFVAAARDVKLRVMLIDAEAAAATEMGLVAETDYVVVSRVGDAASMPRRLTKIDRARLLSQVRGIVDSD